MKKVSITQEEINQGEGNFHDYMSYVRDRLSAKFVEPSYSLFAAADLISADGYKIVLGSNPDDAGLSVTNWLANFYGDRQHISYCFPPIAYQINGVLYCVRMPIERIKEIPLLEAVVGLTEEAVMRITSSKLEKLQADYNEFYTMFYDISRFDVTTIIHLESAADRLLAGAAHYALSRWESLHFIERAMKEVLEQKGVRLSGSDGHDISGALHREWIKAGFPALPIELLQKVMCTPAIRYQRTPYPFIASVTAHHASIRLAAIIAREIPQEPKLKDKMIINNSVLFREGALAIARLYKSMDPTSETWEPVKLISPS